MVGGPHAPHDWRGSRANFDALSVEEALGLAQIKAVEISTAQSGRWDELVEVAIRTQRCAAPRAFEQRLTLLIKYLKSISDDPARVLRDVETEGLAMLAAAKICCEPSNCWSERAKEAIRTVDTSDRSAFEKKLIFRLMYLRDVRESDSRMPMFPRGRLIRGRGRRRRAQLRPALLGELGYEITPRQRMRLRRSPS